MSAPTLLQRLDAVEARVAAACEAAGRARGEVLLLPVSKTRPAADVVEVARASGLRLMAENRVQELVAKADDVPDGLVDWALIGHLQTNKAKDVVGRITQFQGLDSVKIAHALDRRLQAAGLGLEVMVQVNTSREASKAGVAPEQAEELCVELAACASLRPVGLMTIATLSDDPDEATRCFRTLAELRERLRQSQVAGSEWPQLSMGMSGDLEQAIACGSTVVRVGRAIFGERPPAV